MDDSYEFGVIVGKILFYIILIAVIWGIVKLFKKLKIKLFSNATKEELKIYLFWVDFVQGISSIEEFRKKLKKIRSIKVYKNRFNHFYLTKSEATSQNNEVEEISIKDVLASQTYPLFLLERLERITLYGEEDLKNIKISSKMIWTTIKDIVFFMIIDKDKIVYPKDYPQDNKFRFGYEKFFDKDGYIGIYDIENDKLALPFEYKYIQTFGNIVIVSKDEKEYFIYDLNTNETLSKTNNITSLPNNLKEKIDLSKIELIDYLKLFDTPKSKSDLQVVGLWGAKVAVMEVPSQYEEIIEDSSIGTLEWNNYCSADIFDMSVELPVNFKKKNGDYVSLGIDPKYLILEKEYRLRLCTIENLFCKNISENEETSFMDETTSHQIMLLEYLKSEAIINENNDEYLSHTISILRYMLKYYPNLKQSVLFYLDEIMNFVGNKEISVENANAFVELFEVIPAIYEYTSYEDVMELKEFIKNRLNTYKPQDNKIFEEKEVKNKLSLMNYFADNEELFYNMMVK
jgi:hypothetical protein